MDLTALQLQVVHHGLQQNEKRSSRKQTAEAVLAAHHMSEEARQAVELALTATAVPGEGLAVLEDSAINLSAVIEVIVAR